MFHFMVGNFHGKVHHIPQIDLERLRISFSEGRKEKRETKNEDKIRHSTLLTAIHVPNIIHM